MSSLFRITLDTNPETCNLHCIMCEEHSYASKYKEELFQRTGIKQRLMPVEWLYAIFKQAKELGVSEIIPSTMGEPLLYKHFDKIINLCKEFDIKLNLTTNGTIPRKPPEIWAKEIIPITKDIKFSVNGAFKSTAENIMIGLNFDRQIENIRIFSEVRNLIYKTTGHYCSLTFQLTFMRNNMSEIEKIIELAANLDIDRIKGHHVWTHYSYLVELSFKKNSLTKVEWNEIVKRAFASVDKFPRPNGKKILLENFFYLSENENNEVPYEYECPFLDKELWISATGDISPCCAPDNLRKTLGYFGNIKTKTLQDVLNSDVYRNLVKNYKNFEVCKKCNMRRPYEKC